MACVGAPTDTEACLDLCQETQLSESLTPPLPTSLHAVTALHSRHCEPSASMPPATSPTAPPPVDLAVALDRLLACMILRATDDPVALAGIAALVAPAGGGGGGGGGGDSGGGGSPPALPGAVAEGVLEAALSSAATLFARSIRVGLLQASGGVVGGSGGGGAGGGGGRRGRDKMSAAAGQ